jgi:hypothetical protein
MNEMSNLSKRVEKAKKLVFSHSPRHPAHWGTRGSRGKDYGEKYYHVILAHQQETITTPDGKKNISVFTVGCQKDTGNGRPCNCPGNERHAVCYHGLGAIYRSFEQAKAKKLVSFFETYESASQMSFGGKVAKVKSANGLGTVWCVVKDWPEKKKSVDFPSIQIVEQGLSFEKAINEFETTDNKPYPTTRVLSVQHNINLMRGSENDEGIN